MQSADMWYRRGVVGLNVGAKIPKKPHKNAGVGLWGVFAQHAYISSIL